MNTHPQSFFELLCQASDLHQDTGPGDVFYCQGDEKYFDFTQMPEISSERENGLTADILYLPDLFSEHGTDKNNEKKGSKVMSYDKLISLQPFFC